MFRHIALCIALFLFALAPAMASAEIPSSPPLHRGINLSSWFANAPREPLNEVDFRRLAALGFDFVRLPVNPAFIGFNLNGDKKQFDKLDLAKIDRAIEGLTANGLTVILDMHPEDAMRDAIERNPADEDKYIELWKALSAHFAHYPRNQLIYELLNEPQYYHKSQLYNAFAARMVKTIRATEPQRLIIVGTPSVLSFKPLDAIQSTTLFQDPNILYATHYYQPYIISHQGIPFGFQDTQIPFLRHVAYPSSAVNKRDVRVAPNGNYEKAMREVDDYVQQDWNKDKIRAYLKPAADYAKQHNIRLLILEFGVYRPHVDTQSRYRWIKDSREVMDEQGLGWAYWDYADIFGIVTKVGKTFVDSHDGSVKFVNPNDPTNARVIDSAAYDALDLRTP